MRRLVVTVLAVVTVAALAVGVALTRRETERPDADRTLSVVEVLAAPGAGFARATAPRRFAFPGDHGPHREFRTEWWYYTGNVAAANGRRFGYQLTFFRIGLAARAEPRRSGWATTEAWMAHFALTDVVSERFHSTSRLARGALDLAGAEARPFRVWLEDWSAAGTGAGPATPPMRLRASAGDVGIDLTVTTVKPPVLQGDRGWSRKGAEPGNASYYYSLTRLRTRGEVHVRDARFEVAGTSWMDREWSTSALDAGQTGWDWFALQLDDGRELMFYRLRRADGAADPFSAGSLVAPDGASARLRAADLTIEVLAWWTSPRDGTRYPSRWRLGIPRESLTLEVTPRVADQEWTAPVRYWEGAVGARGTAAGRPVTGEGYVELVGYAGASRAR